MSKTRASMAGFGIACFIAACGSGQPGTSSSQGGYGGGSSVNAGGSGGDASGGSAVGGAGGSASGGAAGVASGGAAGSASGGAAGNAGGKSGTTGGASGSGGSQTGGTQTQGSGGAAGNSSGKGGATGGATGFGGNPTGGASGTGGSAVGGTGGSTNTGPILFTSAQNSYWQSGTLTTVTSGNADITVTDTTTYQTWDGFGGTFNEAGWDVLSLLSAADRDRAMKLLFDATDGAGFVFGRIPIGASDYAMSNYTDDETAGDYTMDMFSIARDQDKLIPYIKAALAINPNLHLWASPWTPPTWMKDNGAFAGGNMKDDDKTLQANALYLAKWVQAYAGESITIEAVHPQNEPGYATNYASCLWTPALYTKFVGKYLGPTFTSQNVTAKIFLGTMSNSDSGKDGSIVTAVMADATAKPLIKGIGLQWGMLDNAMSNPSTYSAYNVPLWATEHKCGNYPWASGFKSDKAPNDYPYAVESWGLISKAINQAGVTTYSAWNMVLDNIGKNLDTVRPWPQNSLLIVDRTAKTLTATPVYYVFRHLSQYAAPGAKRVATSAGADVAVAFKNPDGSIVTTIYNSGSSAKTTTLAVGGAKVQFSIPANGFATVKR
jgi:glucosylceramidase